ncbi:NAD(P)-dependent oxidoreductase [Oceanobacillus manasiensis]|uniref:NAD(P)-dependent oxidoreductase n=1 Tax=Oceanobacillus manasiensis TaxID=586413 RepID=UPI000A0477D2|nr:NAD(P)-dependent oxidoreductase [Oceanobacillus manasiensis]
MLHKEVRQISRRREIMNIKEKRIGFIGTGVMGSSMVKNLMLDGYSVSVYTRTKEKATPLLEQGAEWANSVKDLAASSHIIITIVGYPQDVEEVYFGTDGLLAHANPGSYLIDMTTSKPALAKEIYARAKEKGIQALDAPVSGGDIGAKNGTLAIMAGGDKEAFSTVLPVLEAMGENIILQGEAGAGQHTKLSNQIAIATNMIGVCEAIVYAKKAGLDPSRVLDTITTGAAGSFSLSKLAPRMIAGDDAPGFYVKHFIKDMTLALESAKELGMETPGLALSLKLYKELAEKGENDSGTQALIKLFEQ